MEANKETEKLLSPKRRSKGAERQKEEGGISGKDIAMFGAEMIPGVGEAMAVKRTSDALNEKDYLGAGIEATAGLLGIIPGVGDAAGKALRTGFNKTRPAYKLLVQKPDSKLYPLFVQANKNLPKGEWLEAEFPETAFLGTTAKSNEARLYVPTKGAEREPKLYFLEDKQISKEQYDALENNIKPDVKVIKGEKTKGTGTQIRVPDKATADKLKKEGFKVSKSTEKAPHGTVEAVAGRGGFHASQAPVATHLGPEDIVVSNEEVTKLLDAGMTPDAVKTKVFSYTPDGKPISKENIKKLPKEEQAKVVKRPVNYIKRRAEDQVFAVVDMADDVDYESMLAKEGKTDLRDGVPKGGSYRYSDGQADSDQWVVGGDMKIQRVLSREEARAIQKEKNVTDLLYKDEIENILGRKFAKGGIVMDDYLVGKTMDEPQKFAEGGMPVAKQMSMFDEGGLMDEGGTVDPVSGNDVPPGSTQEEVRDDIPAQLSEGEFVFPADVVRYIGLGNLMRIRQEAKMGLKMMEEMGQMGNSEEATMPDDLPFDINDLDMEDELEYNVGGFVPGTLEQQQYGISGVKQSEEPTTGVAAVPQQAASQQYVQPVQAAVPTMTAYKPSEVPTFQQTIGDDAFGTYDELRQYKNEAGNIINIPFRNGQPISPIPEGYTFVNPEATETEEVTTTPTTPQTTSVREEQTGGEDRDSYGPTDEERYGRGGGRYGIGDEMYGVSFENMGTLPGVFGGVQGALGLATGKPLSSDALVNFKQDALEFSLTGEEYNELKKVEEESGSRNSEETKTKFQELRNEAIARKQAENAKRLEEARIKGLERAAALKKAEEQAERIASAQQLAVGSEERERAFGQRDESSDTGFQEGSIIDSAIREAESMVESGYFDENKGGLMSNKQLMKDAVKKVTKKKMKKGGLASKK